MKRGFLMKHFKKMIAPIVITFISLVYLIVCGTIFIIVPGIPVWISVIGCISWILLAGVSIFVFVERIKEIRNGEEDDLSQY